MIHAMLKQKPTSSSCTKSLLAALQCHTSYVCVLNKIHSMIHVMLEQKPSSSSCTRSLLTAHGVHHLSNRSMMLYNLGWVASGACKLNVCAEAKACAPSGACSVAAGFSVVECDKHMIVEVQFKSTVAPGVWWHP